MRIHDQWIKDDKQFYTWDSVYLFNSRLKLFPGNLKSCKSRPYTITQSISHGVVEISHRKKGTFKVNGHQLKYFPLGMMGCYPNQVLYIYF